MVNENRVIHIECGVLGDSAHAPSHFFWPVYQTELLESNWCPSREDSFSVVFTSKNAVLAFQRQIYSKYSDENNWLKLNSICAVGKSTANFIKKTLPNAFFQQNKEVFTPDGQNGLLPLLKQEKIFSKSSSVYIFTSQVGKSFQIVDDVKDKCHFQCVVVPLYTLIEINNDIKGTMAQSILKIEQNSNQKVVFYCRSGQILNRVVDLLIQLFKVDAAYKLPKYIFFSTWEQSANTVLLELKLIDRKFS
ncbi:hypothetical protein [Fluviispira vulneris]|uniref:hypothetical protein n=1 Tax=Fluviispira vulneris TaxID=2763012 RepID=UPI0016454030|nr:hypothetical protein [Fluviispira vulneris]